MVTSADLEFKVQVMTDLVNNAPDLSEIEMVTVGEMIGRTVALIELSENPDALDQLMDIQEKANDAIIKQILNRIEREGQS